MQIERLRHMIEVLRRVKAERRPFDLTGWVCGTACCAVGYAGLDSVFQAQGLKLGLGRGVGADIFPASVDEFNQIISRHAPLDGYPVFSGRAEGADGPLNLRGFPAVVAFFGITYQQAGWLFADDSYELHQVGDPAAVIARIEHLIENRGELPAEIT